MARRNLHEDELLQAYINQRTKELNDATKTEQKIKKPTTGYMSGTTQKNIYSEALLPPKLEIKSTPVVKQVEPKDMTDEQVISAYESIPEHNLLLRGLTTSTSGAGRGATQASKDYEKKQELYPYYRDAKNRQIADMLSKNGIDETMLDNAFSYTRSIAQPASSKVWGVSVPIVRNSAEHSIMEIADKANISMDDIKEYYKAKKAGEFKDKAVSFADEHGILGTGASFGTNLLGTISTLGADVGNYLTGKPIGSNEEANAYGAVTGEMRGAVKENINESIENPFLRSAATFGYDVGTSIGDMGTAMALGGSTGALPIMASSATANSLNEAKSRNLTPDQMMGTAISAGAIEALTEKIPLDNLFKIAKSQGKQGVMQVIKNTLKQAGTEASEEAVAELANNYVDRVINQDESYWNKLVIVYQNEGLTREQAVKKANAAIGKNVMQSALAGMVSGGVTGGSVSAISELKKLDPLNAFQYLYDFAESGNSPEDIKNRVTVAQPASNMTPVAPTLEASPHSPLSVNSVPNSSVNVNGNQTNTDAERYARMLERVKAVPRDNLGDLPERINVGRATVIKKPYMGKVPVQTKVNGNRVHIAQKAYDNAVVNINTAKSAKASTGKSIKTILTKMYENVFAPSLTAKEITVSGLQYEGAKYNVTVNKSVIGKLMSDRNLSAEKIAVLDAIEEIVGNSNYVGSGEYVPHGAKESHDLVRYDYFETSANINGKPYIVTFDVAVFPSTNNYRTHKVINEINLTSSPVTGPVPAADTQHGPVTGPVPAAPVDSSSLSTNSIPNSNANVNGSAGNVPAGTQRERGYNDTFVNKTDAPQEVKNEFIRNPDIYTQLNNQETAAKADAILASGSLDSAIATYHSLLDKKNPVAIPLGYNISKRLSQSGRLDESVQIVREMSRALTESGQFSQAAAITLLNNDPEAAKRYLIRELDTMNQKGKEQYGKKWIDFELNEAELQRFDGIKTGDTDGIKALYEDVYTRLRKEYPSTMTEKLMEYRRVAMLLNVRTNVRNVVSNALLFPVRWTADRVSALGEGVYCLKNPDYQRTQSLNPFRSVASRKLASDAFEMVKSELLDDNKYEDAKGAIRDKQVFKGSKVARMLDTITNGAVTKANRAMGKDINPSLMETAKNFTYWLLQKGDDFFVKKNFESRMASYIQAQGITDIESIPADAYTLATQEALKATFKDDNVFAETLSSARKALNKIPGHFVGEAIFPFTKTPANIAMRGIDYTVGGYIDAVKTMFDNKRTPADVTRTMDSLAKSVTGSTAIYIGYLLAKAGLISGALSEDEDEAQFQKQQGMLPYSININGNYFSYDWAQPASIPLILGVTIYDSMNDDQNNGFALKQGALAAIDSWLELSPLQNLSDIFGGYGSPAEKVDDVLTTDLPLSFLPAQIGAMAKIGDTTQRSTYDQTSYWNNLVNQSKAKIPGLSESLPVSYDTWGNPIQRQDNTLEAVIANLVNPGQFGNENVTPLDSEITRLYESTRDAAVFPKKAAWSVNGVKLNNEQYSEYQRIMGSNTYDMVAELMGASSYTTLSDEQKAGAITSLHEFANALAKSEIVGYDIANSNNYKTPYSIYQDKGAKGVAVFYEVKKRMGEDTSNNSKVAALDALDMSEEEKGYYLSKLVNVSDDATAIQRYYGDAGLYKWYSMQSKADVDGNGKSSPTETINQIAQEDMSYADMLNYASVLYKDGKKQTAREKAEDALKEALKNREYNRLLTRIKKVPGGKNEVEKAAGQDVVSNVSGSSDYEKMLERVRAVPRTDAGASTDSANNAGYLRMLERVKAVPKVDASASLNPLYDAQYARMLERIKAVPR